MISKFHPHLHPLPPGERKKDRNSTLSRGVGKNEIGKGCWDKDEILGFVMPWHTAQLIEKWAQFI